MKIVQIRGTSGSGKTTIARAVMEHYNGWEPYYIDGRRNPIYYVNDEINWAVLGHYESTCGGCDNINSYDLLKEMVYELLEDGTNVLMEGILLSEDQKQIRIIADKMPSLTVYVYFLTTDIETCLDRVRKRRIRAGNTKPLNERNTRSRVARIEGAFSKLQGHPRIVCRRRNGNQTLLRIIELVGNK